MLEVICLTAKPLTSWFSGHEHALFIATVMARVMRYSIRPILLVLVSTLGTLLIRYFVTEVGKEKTYLH